MSYKKKSKKGYQRRQKLMTKVAAKVEKAKKTRPRKRPPSATAPAVTAKPAAPAKALLAGKKITIHYKHGKTKVSGL
jgi:hypothetical protein